MKKEGVSAISLRFSIFVITLANRVITKIESEKKAQIFVTFQFENRLSGQFKAQAGLSQT